MDEPWFRRWMWFSYMPINWRGWAVVAAMLASFGVAVSCLIVFDRDSIVQWVGIATFFVVNLAGNVIVLSKLEQRFNR